MIMRSWRGRAATQEGALADTDATVAHYEVVLAPDA
jgi:hypothetical protein